MNHLYTMKHQVLLYILIIGCLNWGTTSFGYNLVELLSKFININLHTKYPIEKIIYIIISIVALYIASDKHFWLPFLGKTVFPSSLVPLRTITNSNKNITIQTKPNTKIAFWAALPRGDNPLVELAYDNYSNSGVVMSDNNGIAILPIIEGSGYIVPNGKKILRHIHYREFSHNSIIEEVHTVFY
jgi:hypothetical protein